MVAVITVVSLLFAASQAVAFTPLEALVKRQTSTPTGVSPSSFPPACQSQCTSVINTVSACTSLTCICTTSNLDGIQTCINCIVNSAPSASLQSVGQNVLNTYNTDCAGQGVPSLTLGGSAASRTSSSPSATGAARKVGMSMVGVIGAGVVGGIAAWL